jgi:hypothetical protein
MPADRLRRVRAQTMTAVLAVRAISSCSTINASNPSAPETGDQCRGSSFALSSSFRIVVVKGLIFFNGWSSNFVLV